MTGFSQQYNTHKQTQLSLTLEQNLKETRIFILWTKTIFGGSYIKTNTFLC